MVSSDTCNEDIKANGNVIKALQVIVAKAVQLSYKKARSADAYAFLITIVYIHVCVVVVNFDIFTQYMPARICI